MCDSDDLGESFLNWFRDPLLASEGFYEEGEKPIKLFDWDNIRNNDFCVDTGIIFGDKSSDYFRCDNVKFISGMPLCPDENLIGLKISNSYGPELELYIIMIGLSVDVDSSPRFLRNIRFFLNESEIKLTLTW